MWRTSSHLEHLLIWKQVSTSSVQLSQSATRLQSSPAEDSWTNPRRRWPLRQEKHMVFKRYRRETRYNLATLQAHSKNVIHSKTTVSDLKTLQENWKQLET